MDASVTAFGISGQQGERPAYGGAVALWHGYIRQSYSV